MTRLGHRCSSSATLDLSSSRTPKYRPPMRLPRELSLVQQSPPPGSQPAPPGGPRLPGPPWSCCTSTVRTGYSPSAALPQQKRPPALLSLITRSCSPPRFPRRGNPRRSSCSTVRRHRVRDESTSPRRGTCTSVPRRRRPATAPCPPQSPKAPVVCGRVAKRKILTILKSKFIQVVSLLYSGDITDEESSLEAIPNDKLRKGLIFPY